MTTPELIAQVEAELNTATIQVTAWREKQLRAEGALNVLRQLEEMNEKVTVTPDTPSADGGSVLPSGITE